MRRTYSFPAAAKPEPDTIGEWCRWTDVRADSDYWNAEIKRARHELNWLRAAAQYAHDALGWHADDNADPLNQSPPDQHTHVNGLCRQRLAAALKGTP